MKPSYHLIELPERTDSRGALLFAQVGDHLPFPIRRFFLIYDVAPGAMRGGHAHREQHQFLVVFGGAVKVMVDDGQTQTTLTLDRPTLGLYAPPLLWLELTDFTPGAVCLCLTSGIYSDHDYIRDRVEFARLAGTR